MSSYQFHCTWVDLEKKLEGSLEKTLGEVDSKNVFARTLENPKVTGIAGDVIEQSVIGYPANSSQEPDLVIDNIETELKTTGLRKSKKGKGFEAKEPMSITAVSLDSIAGEEFATSNFWHKAQRLLIVYYLYDSEKTVPAAGYANFPIKGYQLHQFSDAEIETLKSDWTLVRNFIRKIQEDYPDENERKQHYPKLSSALRKNLLLIDTAPKYPHPPRFRLKRSAVTTMVKKNFGDNLTQLPKSYTSYTSIDFELHQIAKKYQGKTLGEIADEMGIPYDPCKQNKNLAEQFVTRAFGAGGKMSSIELFASIGLKPKTITLTKSGARTEDMELFTIDFEEFVDDALFDESLFFEYFNNNQLLCMVFNEPSHGAPLTENTFLGFKRMAFDDEFIDAQVSRVWHAIKRLIVNNELVDVVSYDKAGKPIINGTGVIRSAPNFPKSSEGVVFVRGTSSNSTHKPECVNGISMYKQQIWIKGSYAAKRMEEEDWI